MTLTWGQNELRYFESPWSVFEKIKSRNFINSKDLISVYGKEQKNRNGKLSKRERDLWNLQQFDHIKLEDSLGVSLKSHTIECVNQLTTMLPKEIDTISMFGDSLSYCPECIKNNYHSLLHQFKWIHQCPFHLCELHENCTHCGGSIPYQLPQHNFETGFLCDCGELIGGTYSKTQFQSEIKDKTVKEWLNLPESKIDIIKQTIIFGPFIEENKDIMQHLLSICSKEEERERVHYLSKVNKQKEFQLDQVYQDLHTSLYNVMKSFQRLLLNTILKKHKYCITRFAGLYKINGESFPEICPYAYAYIFWKESFYNLNPFLNEVIKPKKKVQPYEIPFSYQEQAFKELTMRLFSQENISYDGAKWCLNHIAWNLAYNHFEDWLAIAKDYAHLKTRPKTKYDDIFNDRSIYLFTKKENRIELYYNYNKKERSIYNLKCPINNENKLKTQETSHLPMRLALTNGNVDAKLAAEQYLRELKILSTIK